VLRKHWTHVRRGKSPLHYPSRGGRSRHGRPGVALFASGCARKCRRPALSLAHGAPSLDACTASASPSCVRAAPAAPYLLSAGRRAGAPLAPRSRPALLRDSQRAGVTLRRPDLYARLTCVRSGGRWVRAAAALAGREDRAVGGGAARAHGRLRGAAQSGCIRGCDMQRWKWSVECEGRTLSATPVQRSAATEWRTMAASLAARPVGKRPRAWSWQRAAAASRRIDR
jgi:hypothetical protein